MPPRMRLRLILATATNGSTLCGDEEWAAAAGMKKGAQGPFAVGAAALLETNKVLSKISHKLLI